MSNRLIEETSPYLLQHAGNPVDWYPWGAEALRKAKEENKLIAVSIGYSACHWCHVMEHESFEDAEVAEIMNQYFICIKVDREERPDVDQVYMTAVQLMTGQGGWPLNCICLPDQRPIYGGTYFGKNNWKNLLLNLAKLWDEKPDEALEYAEKLTKGIHQSEKLNLSEEKIDFSRKDIEDIFNPLKQTLDMAEGGYNRAPKFPLPNNWQFILRYAYHLKEDAAHVATKLTLEKMALGGIYDHIGGGFSRYSVDGFWHVPHFEKMLYDNAQLVSLYSEAFQYSPDDLYKSVVYETLAWVKREMTSPEGGFYSALDADSEGVEGKFYTFTKLEIEEVLGSNSDLFCKYFNITESGNWEDEATNVLRRVKDDEAFSKDTGVSILEFRSLIHLQKAKLFAYRDKRIRPGLDNKILASWNGMMLKGFADAYRVFNEPEFLSTAIENAEFILKNLVAENGSLSRIYKSNRESELPGVAFLDDYALVVEGLISLYEATFNEKWLLAARELCEYALQNFYDPGTGMLFYTSQHAEELIARKFELLDNVIPASNSVMANVLLKLGHFFDDEMYLVQSKQMLQNIFPEIKTYPSGYSNWAILLMNEVFGLNEIAITGEEAEQKRREIENNFIPNKILLGGSSGTLPLLQDKWGGETKIFVCKNRTCQLPVTDVKEALEQVVN
ncbi:thioredoxin domain-containing protein [Pedobacter sp. P351]|uniref:thioredoxin domain-containing protein n=1 Tax=Pedobacter superstes TaxID=3133441 RepID=UPI0030A1D800